MFAGRGCFAHTELPGVSHCISEIVFSAWTAASTNKEVRLFIISFTMFFIFAFRFTLVCLFMRGLLLLSLMPSKKQLLHEFLQAVDNFVSIVLGLSVLQSQ